jgi:hypothetical protein
MTGTKDDTERRSYARRSDEDRIKELEAKIAEIRVREQSKKRRVDPILRDAEKLGRRLRKFAQLAAENDRLDIANSVTAWVASLDRMVRDERLRPARHGLDGIDVDSED